MKEWVDEEEASKQTNWNKEKLKEFAKNNKPGVMRVNKDGKLQYEKSWIKTIVENIKGWFL